MNVNELFKPHSGGAGVQAKIPTKSGEFILSVIAGQHYYSTPREYMEVPNYTEVELAIFDKEGNWASYNQVKPAFEILDQTGEYTESEDNDRPQSSVFGWVVIDKIEEVVNTL